MKFHWIVVLSVAFFLGWVASCSSPNSTDEKVSSAENKQEHVSSETKGESGSSQEAVAKEPVSDGGEQGTTEQPPESSASNTPPDVTFAAVFPGVFGDVRLDKEGNLLVVGAHPKGIQFLGMDLPGEGFFALKLDPKGNIIWKVTGERGEQGNPFGFLKLFARLGSDGKITIAGSYVGKFKLAGKTFDNQSNFNFIVMRLDATGKEVWSAVFPAPNLNISARSLVLDEQQNVWVGGVFSETASFGTHTFTSKGSSDLFVARLDAGGTLQWIKTFGGSGEEEGPHLAVDSNGNLYATGYFNQTVSFGSTQLSAPAVGNLFVTKMDQKGSVIWAQAPSDLEYGSGDAIAVGPNNHIVVTGGYGGYLPFAGNKIEQRKETSFFLTRFDADGKVIWTKGAKGEGRQFPASVVMGSNGEVYVAGSFEKTIWEGKQALQSQGKADGFLAKYDGQGNLLWTLGFHDTGSISPIFLFLGHTGELILASTFEKDYQLGTFSLKKPDSILINTFFARFR